MRAIFFAALVGLGIGLVGASPSLAAPANGSALANAANQNQAVDQVYCAATTIGTGGGGTTGTTAGGNGHRTMGRAIDGPVRSPHPIAARASCASAAMKLARASARLSPRGSST